MAAHAIALKPDVIRACMTARPFCRPPRGEEGARHPHRLLPRRPRQIATRPLKRGKRLGAVDYYIRIHQRFLREADHFITINRCAAAFYRDAYPFLPLAVILRNAALREEPFDYDGRLHEAASLPRTEKILLYQGSYTEDRGLQTLVRAGDLLPDGWTLVMMGWGPIEHELRAIAGTSPKVRFVPAAPRLELAHWTAGASAGIIPYEGAPSSITGSARRTNCGNIRMSECH